MLRPGQQGVELPQLGLERLRVAEQRDLLQASPRVRLEVPQENRAGQEVALRLVEAGDQPFQVRRGLLGGHRGAAERCRSHSWACAYFGVLGRRS